MPAESNTAAILILSAIIMTSFALWADYFGRRMDGKTGAEPGEKTDSPETEEADRSLVRLIGLIAFIAQALLFLSASEARKTYPVVSLLMFFGVLLAQGHIQRRAMARVRSQVSPVEGSLPETKSPAAALLWIMGSSLFYLGLVYSLSAGSFFLARMLHASDTVSAAAAMAGAIAGLVAGLALSFALAPFFMRKAVVANRLEETKTREMIDRCFEKAGISTPSYWVIETGPSAPGNALVAGFQFGRGPFRPALFITRSLLERCTPEETEAVILHEVSHLALHHARKRFFMAAAALLGALLISSFLIGIAILFLPPDAITALRLVALIVSIALPFSVVRSQSQRHEYEADIFAVLGLGGRAEALESALRKLDAWNLPNVPAEMRTHPLTDERIKQLRLAVEEVRKQAAEQAPETETKKAA